MYILGAGLSRTGTTSLHVALQTLGLRSLHWEPDRLSDVVTGANNKPTFNRYDDVDAVTDIPAAYFYRELMEAYPDCKVILTVRDAHAWYCSVKHLFEVSVPRYITNRRVLEEARALQQLVYGSERVTEFLYKKRFNDHNDAVQRLVPRQRLLVMDIASGDGWSKLCPFLGIAIPKIDFPDWNKTSDDSWKKVRDKATQEIAAVIPPGANFILADQDEWAYADLAAGRRATPFLERDGQYWGAPADDVTAVRELERLRQAGAAFMVVGQPAFWWLDYYAGLHRHLRSNFPCVMENERIVVFDLGAGAEPSDRR